MIVIMCVLHVGPSNEIYAETGKAHRICIWINIPRKHNRLYYVRYRSPHCLAERSLNLILVHMHMLYCYALTAYYILHQLIEPRFAVRSYLCRVFWTLTGHYEVILPEKAFNLYPGQVKQTFSMLAFMFCAHCVYGSSSSDSIISSSQLRDTHNWRDTITISWAQIHRNFNSYFDFLRFSGAFNERHCP